MELLHIIYHKPNDKDQSILLLHIGRNEGKITGLLTEHLTDFEVSNLRKSSKYLGKMSTGTLVRWLKQHIKSYKKAFRGIYEKNCTIVSRYNLG